MLEYFTACCIFTQPAQRCKKSQTYSTLTRCEKYQINNPHYTIHKPLLQETSHPSGPLDNQFTITTCVISNSLLKNIVNKQSLSNRGQKVNELLVGVYLLTHTSNILPLLLSFPPRYWYSHYSKQVLQSLERAQVFITVQLHQGANKVNGSSRADDCFTVATD